MRVISLIVLLLVAIVCSEETQDNCFTADNIFGLCVPYSQCTYLKSQLESFGDAIPRSFSEYVKNSRCGDNSSDAITICCEPRHIKTA